MPGAWHTRSLVCKGRKHTSSHHRHAETIRHSLRNGFNGLSSRSPRSAGLDSLRRLVDHSVSGPWGRHRDATRLDPSVGGSGPHDFAVRTGRARLARHCVHRIPHHVS